MPYVIGTAGHVDHGKSTLVQALSGIDPDRLEEEKRRALTIDLGFAWFDLPSGQTVGVVDVPGHRDFIENMLSGVGGIDCVLVVIAADEGVMPQTREHLAIVDLLDIPTGVIALTKTDLVEDEDWLTLVEDDVRSHVQGTALEDAPLVHVSVLEGQGIDAVREALDAQLEQIAPRSKHGVARLPIDRVFSIKGFGTVVTGTLLGGTLTLGDEVTVMPGSHEGRIRGIQAHKQAVEHIPAGMRVAINVSGIAVDDIQRGDVLTLPNRLRPTRNIDVSYRHLLDVPLEHDDEVKFFVGASECMARVRVIGAEAITDEGMMQLRLEYPLALSRGDRFILRRPSPPATIGGGVILDPYPQHRWRRYRDEVLERFERLQQPGATHYVLEVIGSKGGLRFDQLVSMVTLDGELLHEVIEGLESDGLIGRAGDHWITTEDWVAWQQAAVDELERFHANYPLHAGMPREELRQALRLNPTVFGALIAALHEAGALTVESHLVRRADFSIVLNATQQKAVDALWDAVKQAPTAPPSVKEAKALVGADVFAVLVGRGDVILVDDHVFFDTATYTHMVETVLSLIDEHGAVSVGDVRDHFDTSRKYTLALLEHMDREGFTQRKGDSRVRS